MCNSDSDSPDALIIARRQVRANLLGDAEGRCILAGLVGAHALALKEGEDVLVARQKMACHHDEVEIDAGRPLPVGHGCYGALHCQSLCPLNITVSSYPGSDTQGHHTPVSYQPVPHNHLSPRPWLL